MSFNNRFSGAYNWLGKNSSIKTQNHSNFYVLKRAKIRFVNKNNRILYLKLLTTKPIAFQINNWCMCLKFLAGPYKYCDFNSSREIFFEYTKNAK